jgi:nucleoid DNA-binding protein
VKRKMQPQRKSGAINAPPRLLPNIDAYLESTEFGRPISSTGIEHLRAAIVSHTSLSEDAADAVLRLFFHEIRSAMLKGEAVTLRCLGSFLISSPKTTNNMWKIFPRFRASTILRRRLNGR